MAKSSSGRRGRAMPEGRLGIGALDARYEHAFMKNVRDYGAAADGTTDDTDAIKSARDACSANEILFFPYGRYYISETLTISNNLCVQGVGPGTQIFMASDDDLFSFTGNGFCSVRDVRLGSAATTADKCLIKLGSDVSHYLIDNVWMIGGYYGLGLYGAMHGLIKGIVQTSSFYRAGTSTNQAWIHGERSGGHSINGTKILGSRIQAGVRGIEITDTNSEVTVTIDGNLIESLSDASIYLQGVGQFAEIRGLHCEASSSHIELVNCRNVGISGCYCSSGVGISLENCKRVKISCCYLGELSADSDCVYVDVEDCAYVADPSLQSHVTRLRNMEDTGNTALGGSGMYSGETGYNMVEGDLETWSGGAPTDFSVTGTVVQDTSVVKRGSSSAKVTLSATCGLRYDLDMGIFSQKWKTISVRAWVYKPSSNGCKPRIALVASTGVALSPLFDVTEDTWTPINQTFTVPYSATTAYILIGEYNSSQTTGTIMYIDDVVMSEEQF